MSTSRCRRSLADEMRVAKHISSDLGVADARASPRLQQKRKNMDQDQPGAPAAKRGHITPHRKTRRGELSRDRDQSPGGARPASQTSSRDTSGFLDSPQRRATAEWNDEDSCMTSEGSSVDLGSGSESGCKRPASVSSPKPTPTTPSQGVGVSTKVTIKSFYGSSKTAYLSPLERVEKSRLTSPPAVATLRPSPPVVATLRPGTPVVVGPDIVTRSVRRKSCPVYSSTSTTSSAKKRNAILSPSRRTNAKPKTKTSSDEFDEILDKNLDKKADDEPNAADKQKENDNGGQSTKRFFRHRSSPGSAATSRCITGVVGHKGFHMNFKRSRNSPRKAKAKKTPPVPKPKVTKPAPVSTKYKPALEFMSPAEKAEERDSGKDSPSPAAVGESLHAVSSGSAGLLHKDSGSDAAREDFSQDLFTDVSRESTPPAPSSVMSSSLTSAIPRDAAQRSGRSGRSRGYDAGDWDSLCNDSSQGLADPPTDQSCSECSDRQSLESEELTSKKFYPIFKPKQSPSLFSNGSSGASTPVAGTPDNGGKLRSERWSGKTSPRHVLPTLRDKDGKEQMVLDFGQKLKGAIQCEDCGMTFQHGEPSDEAMHAKFHQKVLAVLRFPGWKNENVLQHNADGSRIIVVMPNDKLAMKKVEAVKSMVDRELGFVVERRVALNTTKTFLYISTDKRVVGCCIAQVISQGYRVLGDEESQSGERSPSKKAHPWCCSMEPEPVKCGISRIWVLSGERRKNVASTLLDCVRMQFLMGYPLSKLEIAFSDPTPDGRRFATRYTGTPCFLVYKHS